MKIEPKLMNLTKLFHERVFRIPDYQRSYRWNKTHRNDLFRDIETSMDKNTDHFMATVVGLKSKQISIDAIDHQQIEVVDGQQRITTLILLYKAIAKKLRSDNGEENRIKENIEETLVKSDNATTLLLQNNHDTIGYFSDYLRYGKNELQTSNGTSAEKTMKDAILDCELFVEKYVSNNKSLVELVSHINNRIWITYQELDEQSLVYSVFEVLNSRGLAVSWFDRLKVALMGTIYDDGNSEIILNEVQKRWANIYKKLGTLPLESEILRFAATMQEGGPRILSEEKSVTHFKTRATQKRCDAVIEIVSWLEKVTHIVVEIKNDPRESTLNRINHTKFVAAAIKLRDDFSDNIREDLYNHCSKVAFRIFFLHSNRDARLAVGDFVRLGHKIYQKKISSHDIKNELSEISNGHDIDFKWLAKNTELYKKYPDEIRHLLYRYEEHLSGRSSKEISTKTWNLIWDSSASDTIEHILPQSSKKDYADYLGNFFLLPKKINSKLKDTNPINKKDAYHETGFSMANEINLDNWNKKAIDNRSNKIIEWMRQEWNV